MFHESRSRIGYVSDLFSHYTSKLAIFAVNSDGKVFLNLSARHNKNRFPIISSVSGFFQKVWLPDHKSLQLLLDFGDLLYGVPQSWLGMSSNHKC